jgi:Uma2 family endonuclease
MAQHATIAPWAEEVPGAPFPMTVDEVMRLAEQNERWMYELVGGRLVRMPLSGGDASRIAARLVGALIAFVEAQDLGAVLGADMAFDLTQPGDVRETVLAPDAAFVRIERVPPQSSPEYVRAWRLAPDLMAEIASPNQYRPEMTAKMQHWMAAGVRLGWLVWPKSRQVDVWRPGSPQSVATLTTGESLDGLDVLPGFSYSVARLFGA